LGTIALIAFGAALVGGLATGVAARFARLDRIFIVAWALVGAIALGTIARTLISPDPKTSAALVVADFAVPADVTELQGTSSLDVVAKEGAALVLTGWTFDERTHEPGDAMYLDIDGTNRIDGHYGDIRPDVAAAFHSPTAGPVGFRVTIQPGNLAPGEHRVRIGLRVRGERFESVRRYAVVAP
jgi:hypothetical protein